MIVSLWWKSWRKRPKCCQCLVHLLWWWCLIQRGYVFVRPWFVTLGWRLCKQDNARRDWWRSHSLQTGAGSALLLLKNLFHSEVVQMTPALLSRQVLWQVLLLYQLQQEGRTPDHLLTEAAAMLRKNASSCYLICFPLPCLSCPTAYAPLPVFAFFSSIDSKCC